MKRLLFILIACNVWSSTCTLSVPLSSSFWTWGSWQAVGGGVYKASLTYNHLKVGTASSTNFPALVYASGNSMKDVAHGGFVNSSTGADILFYSDSALTTQIASEIPTGSYDNVNGVLKEAWVLIATLSNTTNGTIWATVGNPSPPARTAGVWANGFVFVAHLGEASSTTVLDSVVAATSDYNTFTQAAGKIAGSASLSGAVGQYITFPDLAAYGIRDTLTVSAWVNTSTATLMGIVDRKNNDYLLYQNGSTKLAMFNGVGVFQASAASYNDGAWHYVAGTWNTAGPTIAVTVDQVSAGNNSGTQLPLSSSNGLWIGRTNDTTSFNWTGGLDELRVANVVRSSSWMTAEYYNQSYPGNLVDPGPYACNGGTCVLSSIQADSTHVYWTGSGCTADGFVPSNGDSVIVSAVPLTVDQAWTIGSSPATAGTAAIALGPSGSLIVDNALTLRGDMTSSMPGTSFLVVNAGGSLSFDSSAASSPSSTYYEIVNASGGAIALNGTGTDCTFNGSVFAGTTCATITSTTANSALAGDVSAGLLAGSYAAFSNLGTAARTAITAASGGMQMGHFSVSNSGQTTVSGPSHINIHHFSFLNGINTQDEHEDLLVSISAFGGQQRVITDGLFFRSYKLLVPPGPFTLERLYATIPPSFATPAAAAGSTCNESIYALVSGDIGLVCTSTTYLVLLMNLTATTGHLLDVPGAAPAGSTVTIENLYCEFPDPDAGSNQGKCLLTNQSNPASPTITNVRNLLLVPDKNGNGNAEIAGGAGILDTSNNILSIQHATAYVQSGSGGAQAFLIDEGGTANNTILDIQSSVFLSNAPFYKSLSVFPSAPSNNLIKVPDYNVAGSAVIPTNTACPNCTNQANGWTHKCTAGSGITCPAGTHDLDVVAGAPVAPQWSTACNGVPCPRIATWDTLGSPAHAVCAAWVTSTVYTYTAGSPVCVSVSGVYGVPINYTLTASHTSGATTKPDVGANWRTVWEYSSLYTFRQAIVAGTTYSGDSPVKAFWNWVGNKTTGWAPTNKVYATTFPGDTNTVTNMGAFPLGSAANGNALFYSIP